MSKPNLIPAQEDRHYNKPMNADLSWFTWYGFSLLAGLRGHRDVKVISTCKHVSHYSLVQDTQTQRLFVMDERGGIVQYTTDSQEFFTE